MAGVNLTYGAYLRSNFPPLTQLNMVAERTASQIQNPLALIVRPGLDAFAEVGDGPLRGINRKAGLFDEAAVVVSGDGVFTLSPGGVVTQKIGMLSTDKGRVQIALGRDSDGNSQARIADGQRLYLVSGNTVVPENFPSASETDGADSIAYIRQFWLAVKAGTQQVYYLVPGDTDWNALEFASAEYQPDPIIDIGILGDQIFLLGSASTEVWSLTGTTAPAIAPYGGLAWDLGCKGRDTVCNMRGMSLIWVTDKCEVVQSFGSTPQVISDNGLSEQIRKSDPRDLRAWTFSIDQHVYYVLSLTDQTWIYDTTTKLWTTASSLGLSYWRAHLGTDLAGDAYALDSAGGSSSVWKVNPDSLTDVGDEIIAQAVAFYETKNAREACGNITLICQEGVGLQTGLGEVPLILMSWSDDQGKTWVDWKPSSLGRAGQYEHRVRWNRLGLIRAPGRYFRFRRSDPVVYRMSDVRMNEQL